MGFDYKFILSINKWVLNTLNFLRWKKIKYNPKQEEIKCYTLTMSSEWDLSIILSYIAWTNIALILDFYADKIG